MKYLLGLSDDTKLLGTCSRNRTKLLLNGILSIKIYCHTQNNQCLVVYRLLRNSSAQN